MKIGKKLLMVVVSSCMLCHATEGASAVKAIGTLSPAFGLVDVDAVFQSDSGNKIETLQADFTKRQGTLDQEQQSLEGQLQDFKKNAPTMAVKAREAREIELRKETETLSAKRAQLTQEYYKGEQDIKMSFMHAMNTAAEKVAKKKGLHVVLPKQVAIYGEVSLDVTTDVISSMK
ncbi:OmpH family outer membrane protein [Gammaproteobacteria bacterium]|nr:OmpH family outer membrane protein [Gammaproteobacteria bacterium]